jgi:hypothetical protein
MSRVRLCVFCVSDAEGPTPALLTRDAPKFTFSSRESREGRVDRSHGSDIEKDP